MLAPTLTPKSYTMISADGNTCETFVTLGNGPAPASTFTGHPTMYPGKCDTKYWVLDHQTSESGGVLLTYKHQSLVALAPT